ncbi:MAG: hypothetical protein EBR82_46775 [Caulobacteraceae bacterium]|nr:hypothetical protein [Caulobacteraceae bacterium]
MTDAEYRAQVLRTLAPNTPEVAQRVGDNLDLLHAALGLAGESLEVIEAVKKYMFFGRKLTIAQVTEELGGVLYYLVALCDALSLDLDDVRRANVAQLQQRYPDGYTDAASAQRDKAAEMAAIGESRERDCAVATLRVMAALMRCAGGPELPEWVTRTDSEVDAP